MKNIIDLTKMSLNNLSSIFKNLWTVLIIWLVISVFNPAFLSMLFGLGTYMILYQVMAYEDLNGIDNLIWALPVKRSEYVISRYVLGLFTSLTYITTLSIMYFITNMVIKVDVNIEVLAIIGLMSTVLVVSVIIPIVLKFGANKGKMLIFLVLVVVIAVPITIIQSMISDTEFMGTIISAIGSVGLSTIIILASAIMIAISMAISLKVYKSKEIR